MDTEKGSHIALTDVIAGWKDLCFAEIAPCSILPAIYTIYDQCKFENCCTVAHSVINPLSCMIFYELKL